ncbi:hypothetical protein SUDANB66_06467 (plasmid) [Streptomyces sp. SudanB66_2053]
MCELRGVPQAAGLCIARTLRRETDVLVAKVVDIAVTLRADVKDVQASVTMTDQVPQNTWAFVHAAEVPERDGGSTLRAFTQRDLAR